MDACVTTLPLLGYRQTRMYTCGFATSLMVLRYFSADVPAMELYKRLGTSRDGTRQTAIVRELRSAGVRANARYDLDFARLRREVDRNKLIIGYLHDAEHWLVVYGYGREPDRVFVADPRPAEPCEHAWRDYGPRLRGFGIVCSERGVDAAVRQTPLALDPVDPPDAPDAPLIPRAAAVPLGRLRCEVHDDAPSKAPPPAQLALPL